MRQTSIEVPILADKAVRITQFVDLWRECIVLSGKWWVSHTTQEVRRGWLRRKRTRCKCGKMARSGSDVVERISEVDMLDLLPARRAFLSRLVLRVPRRNRGVGKQ
jgi:hypothetical protein